MTIGNRIRDKRKKLGISQTNLAVRVGVSKQTLYKYENAIVANIPMDKIELLAAALETTPSYLMGWDQKNNNDPSSQGGDEARLIKKYSQLSETNKTAVLNLIDNLLLGQSK